MDSYPGDDRDLACKFVATNVYLTIVIVADIRVVKVRDFVLRHFCSTAVSATIRLCLSRGMNPLLLCSKANYSRTFRHANTISRDVCYVRRVPFTESCLEHRPVFGLSNCRRQVTYIGAWNHYDARSASQTNFDRAIRFEHISRKCLPPNQRTLREVIRTLGNVKMGHSSKFQTPLPASATTAN